MCTFSVFEILLKHYNEKSTQDAELGKMLKEFAGF